jgi:NAD(P)-dependent dehydrogenase (short-subunit alcohol dehydrogenase family)
LNTSQSPAPSAQDSARDGGFRLDGRTAFLSGAAGHLGTAMATALARAGAHVILNGRTESKLRALADVLGAEDLACSVAAFDVLDRPAANRFLGGLERLDVLINNAISGLPSRPDATAADAFNAMLASGVTAAYDNVQAALPALEAAVGAVGQASVINVTSIYAHVSPVFSLYGDAGFVSPPQYAAAKGGLLQLTRYLACSLAPRGIRVNSLSPGIFPWTEIERDRPDFVERVSQKSPMGRTGRAAEIGGPTVFLASDAASYMTGADLLIDGGWTAW